MGFWSSGFRVWGLGSRVSGYILAPLFPSRNQKKVAGTQSPWSRGSGEAGGSSDDLLGGSWVLEARIKAV